MKLSVSHSIFPGSSSDQLWTFLSCFIDTLQLSAEVSKDSGSTTFPRDFDVLRSCVNHIPLDFNTYQEVPRCKSSASFRPIIITTILRSFERQVG